MKILIVRFSSFGDVLLTTPVIREIRNKYPEAEIDFIVYTSFSEAVSLNPEIRKLILFDRKKSKDRAYIKETIEKLRMEKYDFILDLHSKLLSRIIGRSLAGERTRYYRYKKRKWWKTLLVKAGMIDYHADCTIVESYFTALRKLDIIYNIEDTGKGQGDRLEFYISSHTEEDIIEKYGLKDKKYIVLAPGASKFTKKWPFYNNLSEMLLKYTDMHIFVIGGKEDSGVVKEGKEGRITDLCGKISFKESGVIIRYSEGAVVNDSGPFHIARALGTMTFVFFGPTDPKLFSFEEKTFLISNPDCSPHSLYGDDKFPKKYEDCMKGIKVEDVFSKIMDRLENREENV